MASVNDSITVEANDGQTDEKVQITYLDVKVSGNGSFGTVYKAKLLSPTSEIVAIKKVLIDRRYKNRELQTMKMLDHQNIVKLKYNFNSQGEKKDMIFLNLVLEFIPDTVSQISRSYAKDKQTMPLLLIKLYMYQLFRSLAYIHSKGICHRDIKPQNLLVNQETGVLKLCDFGSAKILKAGEPNVSYICSRFFRAPELIFGAVQYTCQIDIWSTGCVLAELLLKEPIFPGESAIDQLVEIIKVLGTPTPEQIRTMNPDYKDFSFPQIKKSPWPSVFSSDLPKEPIDLVSNLLDYTPNNRLTSIEAMKNEFFKELRYPKTKLLNGSPLPPLFNFTPEEKAYEEGFSDFFTPLPDTEPDSKNTGNHS